MPRWLIRLNAHIPIRYAAWVAAVLGLLYGLWLWATEGGHHGWALALVCTVPAGLGLNDMRQAPRSILRNYPVIGHLR
jgi:hypothetical protein